MKKTVSKSSHIVTEAPASLLDLPPGIVLDADLPFGSSGRRVHRYMLDNGLRAIFLEDHSAPIFSFQTWYQVGSSCERPGKTGLAHLFEHLMFKGTPNHPVGEFDRLMEQCGAQTNAGTWLDWTFYYENLPAGDRSAEALDLVADFEADRMQHLALDEETFRSELEVVKNERRLRVDNDPDGKMDEVMWKLAFHEHPYHWPTIGWMEDLDHMSREDALNFYRGFYAPNRAVIVVVGDVDQACLLDVLNRRFGPIPRQHVKRPARIEEPPQIEPRCDTLHLPLSGERALLGWHVPGIDHPDLPALDILCEILFNSDGARAERVLVHEREMALSVSGWVGSFEDPSLFQVSIACRPSEPTEQVVPGARAKAALTVLDELVGQVQEEMVSDAELARAGAKIRMALLRSMLTSHTRGYQLGFYEVTAGDFAGLFRFIEAVKSVGPDDVRRVARTYLRPERCTTIFGLPEDTASGAGVKSIAAAPKARVNPRPFARGPVPTSGTADSPASAEAGKAATTDDLTALGAQAFNAGPVEAIVIPDWDLPYVSFSIDLYTGGVLDPPGREGLACMTGEMLMRGSTAFDRAGLANALDSIGSNLDISVYRRAVTVRGDAALEHIDTFFELLAEVLARPVFPEAELEKLRRQTQGEIRALRDDDAALARRAFSHTLFRDHPWGRPISGTTDSVAAITRDDVEAFYRDHFRTARVVFGASGAIDAAGLAAGIAGIFPGQDGLGAASLPATPRASEPGGLVVVLVDKPERTQTQVVLGHTVPGIEHPAIVPMSMGNTAFGGSFTGRMMQEVRVKRGWSYGAYSQVSVGRDMGTFQASFYPKTADTLPALELVLEMLADLREQGLLEDELTFARERNIHGFAFSMETHPKRLRLLLNSRLLDRSADWISSRTARLTGVSLEGIRAAFAGHLHPDRLVVAITCTASDLIDGVRQLPGLHELWLQPYDQPWAPRRLDLPGVD